MLNVAPGPLTKSNRKAVVTCSDFTPPCLLEDRFSTLEMGF